VKKKVLPDNLHFAGVTYDNAARAFHAMVEVEGKGPKFMKPGEKVGVWEVTSVSPAGLTVKDKAGKVRTLALGTAFHDGVTVRWEIEGGPPPSPKPASSASSGSSRKGGSGGSTPKLDDAKRREIIERLKKKRAEAMRKKRGK
jgi:hypothetical protein